MFTFNVIICFPYDIRSWQLKHDYCVYKADINHKTGDVDFINI